MKPKAIHKFNCSPKLTCIDNLGVFKHANLLISMRIFVKKTLSIEYTFLLQYAKLMHTSYLFFGVLDPTHLEDVLQYWI